MMSFKSSKVQGFNRILLGFLVLTLELLNPLNLERASAQQTPYYQGKTIRVVVGYQPGDSHDLWARTYTRYLGKFIPGNPTFLVQNMPGAGGMIAANYIFNVTKPDGLTHGHHRRRALLRSTDRPQRKQNSTGTSSPGSARRNPPAFSSSCAPTRRIKLLDDLRTTNDPPQCSATGVGSAGYDFRGCSKTLGAEIQSHQRLPRRRRPGSRHGTGRSALPRIYHRSLFRARALFPPGSRKTSCACCCKPNGSATRSCRTCRRIYELMDRYKIPRNDGAWRASISAAAASAPGPSFHRRDYPRSEPACCATPTPRR